MLNRVGSRISRYLRRTQPESLATGDALWLEVLLEDFEDQILNCRSAQGVTRERFLASRAAIAAPLVERDQFGASDKHGHPHRGRAPSLPHEVLGCSHELLAKSAGLTIGIDDEHAQVRTATRVSKKDRSDELVTRFCDQHDGVLPRYETSDLIFVGAKPFEQICFRGPSASTAIASITTVDHVSYRGNIVKGCGSEAEGCHQARIQPRNPTRRNSYGHVEARTMRRILLALAVLAIGIIPAVQAAPPSNPPILDQDGSIAAAVATAEAGLQWWSLDGHLHTDHSHDAGFFHQQSKRPENHDTYVVDQIGEAERQQMDAITLTDHRTYDGAYDPAYRSSALLLDGEEWGSYPHSTAWGISEQLDEGPAEQPVSVCGVARASREVRAQDGVFGVAHPEDGRRPCIDVATLKNTPIDHLEAFRWPHTDLWLRNIQANRRLVPVTGSDNHFKQLYGSQGGTGASTTFILARDLTKPSLVDAIRAGRVISGTRALGPTMSSFLDANNDGVFEALTGGWSEPTGGTVRVAFHIERGPGHWLEILDDQENLLAQWPINGVDTVYAYDLPSNVKYIRAQLSNQPIERVTGGVVHDYLSYEDSLRVLSAPLYLTAPDLVEGGNQGDASKLSSDVPFAGFADIAREGTTVHAVWQERHVPTYSIAYARSEDDGATWSDPQIVTDASEEAVMPAVTATDGRVSVAYERKLRGMHGGEIVLRSSEDGFESGVVISDQEAARPEIASAGDAVHVAYMQMTEDGYAIRYIRYEDGIASSRQISHGVATDGPLAMWATVPHNIRHIPAAVHPAITVAGTRVTVAWEDNREDQTPLRNATPDDWGIYSATSLDLGNTWSADARISPRQDRTPPNAADPEKMEGNPARHVALLEASDGSRYASWQNRNSSNGYTILVSRFSNGTWSSPVTASASTGEFAYKPQLAEIPGGVRVVWQQSANAVWTLRTATSTDAGASFSPSSQFTTGTGYAGFPSVAGDTVLWTGESNDLYGVWTKTF